jgi:hypothetical protein
MAKLKRSQRFSPLREPLRELVNLKRHVSKTSGPFGFLNPTRAHFHHVHIEENRQSSNGHTVGIGGSSSSSEQDLELPPHEQTADKVEYVWTSRNNRKGRHLLEVTPARDPAKARYLVPDSTKTLRTILRNIGCMFTKYPVWDVSWLVAYVFTWGSIVWVINALYVPPFYKFVTPDVHLSGFMLISNPPHSSFVWLPQVRPSSEFEDEILIGGGVTAFIGATIFEIGSFLLLFEAVNENRTGCFGWAVEQILNPNNSHKGPWLKVSPSPRSCKHHHQNRRNLVGKSQKRKWSYPAVQTCELSEEEEEVEDRANNGPEGKSWVWFPPWRDLRDHYLRQLGFIASSAQLFGATVFWISGLTALPPIFTSLTTASALNGAYWVPQIIGGSGFIVSGVLFMLETQRRWWKPAFGTLGWHVGFWNLVGGVGFTLCPCFGIDTHSWAQYQASLSTFWGSWAFLIGSLIQLYESLLKHPVEVAKPEPRKGSKAEARVLVDVEEAEHGG